MLNLPLFTFRRLSLGVFKNENWSPELVRVALNKLRSPSSSFGKVSDRCRVGLGRRPFGMSRRTKPRPTNRAIYGAGKQLLGLPGYALVYALVACHKARRDHTAS